MPPRLRATMCVPRYVVGRHQLVCVALVAPAFFKQHMFTGDNHQFTGCGNRERFANWANGERFALYHFFTRRLRHHNNTCNQKRTGPTSSIPKFLNCGLIAVNTSMVVARTTQRCRVSRLINLAFIVLAFHRNRPVHTPTNRHQHHRHPRHRMTSRNASILSDNRCHSAVPFCVCIRCFCNC